MAGNRWQNLDFDAPARRAETGRGRTDGSEGGLPARGRRAALENDALPAAGSLDRVPQRQTSTLGAGSALPVVKQAMGAYLVRNYPMVLDLLEPCLRDQPELPGGPRTLGMALARLNREAEAISWLQEAVQRAESDWLARAALASLLLQGSGVRGQGTDTRDGEAGRLDWGAQAAAHLEAAWGIEPRPALRELLGAACWLGGQESLGSGRHEDAARQFSRSAVEFAAAAEQSGAARHGLPARQTAAFIGEATALLSAGQIEAAQRLFSRAPVPGIRPRDSLSRFAAGLYELCEALGPASPAERQEAAAALRTVVLAARLRVGFYDGRQAVSLAWTGDWDEGG